MSELAERDQLEILEERVGESTVIKVRSPQLTVWNLDELRHHRFSEGRGWKELAQQEPSLVLDLGELENAGPVFLLLLSSLADIRKRAGKEDRIILQNVSSWLGEMIDTAGYRRLFCFRGENK